MSEHGKYLVIEGGADGIGKSTQAHKLVDRLNDYGVTAHYAHEPGLADQHDDEIENIMEDLTKNPSVEMSPVENLLAFTIARSAVYRKKIQPAIEAGEWVVSDRNWLSSVAYQGEGEGLGRGLVRDTTRLYLPIEYLYPDFTFMAFVSKEQRQALRTGREGSDVDSFERRGEDFQLRVEKGYQNLDSTFVKFRKSVGKRAVQSAKYISFDGSIEDVHKRLWLTTEEHLL